MRVTVVKEDLGYTVIVDGHSLHVEQLPISEEISAIQWDGTTGEIEYCDCQQHPNEPILDAALVDQCVAAWTAEKERQETAREAAREAWENSWERVRQERDAMIAATDWMVLPDSPLSESDRTDILAYRQQLRDVPQVFDSPADVVWPEKPSTMT